MTEFSNRTASVVSGKFGNMYSIVKKEFPTISDKIKRWGRYDAASIFLETVDRMTYIFTYRNDRDWCFQTKTNYLNGLKENERHR